jgi:cation:H+ antiporter
VSSATSLAVLIGLAAVGSALAWKGGDWLVEATDRLGARYGVPEVVQGAVVAAIGSSFPEFASTVFAAARGFFTLGVGAVVGSAVFNILVIPAVSALAGGGFLDTDRDLVFKETQFYLLSLSAVLLTFAVAAVYEPIESDPRAGGTVTPLMALALLALYGLYVFVQWADTAEMETPERTDGALRDVGLLAGSLLLVLIGAEALVRSAVGLGEFFGTPPFLWGLTVVAAGTSLPDTFVSVSAARSGNAALSLANVLGSNVFALLVALPAGAIVAGGAEIAFSESVFMFAFLVVASIAFFVVLRTDLTLSRREAYVLLSLYAAFLVVVVAESVGLAPIPV